MSLDNLQIDWAQLLIDTLARCGVRYAVISPGSRSTPLTMAAAGHPEIEAIPVIDERSAAFFALGLARARGVTPLLICTSGTAAAHYYPAVIEASLSQLPLLVLTADRPPELQHRGAAQTIDQRLLFGGYVRVSYELGPADDSPEAWRGLRATAARAVAQAGAGGPVHLNASFRKPLEPQPETARDRDRRAQLAELAQTPLPHAVRPVAVPDQRALTEFAARLARAERGLVVAGPATPGRAGLSAPSLAAQLGWPLLADSASQLRRPNSGPLVAFYELLLRTRWAHQQQPDLVVVIGAEPSGIGWARWSATLSHTEWLCLGTESLPDPENRVAQWLVGDLEPTLAALIAALRQSAEASPRCASDWADGWQRADRAARALTIPSDPDAPLTEPDAVHAVAASLSADQALMLSNSLPIRSVDSFAMPTPAAPILHQRGANGIDGSIAAAAAAAQPTTLLIGDVAFLHDLGSLAIARSHAEHLTIVVLDNDGGRIFDQLPIASRPELGELFERFFRTPPQLDIADACRAFGVACERVTTLAQLRRALATPFQAPTHVIWADLVPESAQSTLQRRVAELDRTPDR